MCIDAVIRQSPAVNIRLTVVLILGWGHIRKDCLGIHQKENWEPPSCLGEEHVSTSRRSLGQNVHISQADDCRVNFSLLASQPKTPRPKVMLTPQPKTPTPKGNAHPSVKTPEGNAHPSVKTPEGNAHPSVKTPEGNAHPSVKTPEGNAHPSVKTS